MISTYLRPRRAVAWIAAAALAASGLSLGLAAPAQAAAVTVTVKDTFGNGVDAWLDVSQEDPGDPGTYEPYDEFFVPGNSQIELPDGNYKIEIFDDNDVLRTEWYDNQLDFDAATVVTVAGSPLVLNPIVLDPRPVITGVVRLAGVPVAGAFVEVLTADFGFDTTDSLGRFAIPVDPGTHEVLFGDFEDRFAGEYWQDQYDQSTATPVVVGGASVDLGVVNVGPGVNFSGTVTGPTGVPLRGVIVTAFQEAAPFESEATVTDTAGQYYIGGLPPGTYKVAFEDPNDEYIGEFWNDTTLQASATPLVLATDQAAANINAALALNPTGGTEPPGTDASGVVRNAAGQPLSGIRVDALTTTPTIDDAALSDFDYTDSQGRYFLTNLNGDNQFKLVYEDQDLTVSGELPYLTEWYKDRRTYNTADPITVAGTKVTGLDAVLQQSGGIQGTVTNEIGTVLPRSNMELIDVNGNFLGSTAGYTDGSYEFTSLRPGTYYVHFAFGSNFEDDEFVPEWFDDAAIQADAAEIVVEEGEFTDGIDGALADALQTVERPTISGKVRVGRTVSADTGLWNLTGGTTFAYQWLRGKTVVGTEATYEVVKFDAGKKLQLVVSAINGELTGLAKSQPVRAKFTSKVTSSSKDGVLTVKVKVKDLKKKAIKGKVKIKKGKETLATLDVEKGEASIKLSAIKGLKKGKNKLKIVYVGTKRIASDDAELRIRR